MVKSYLRYEAGAVFGLVVSPAAQPAALFDRERAPRRAVAAAGENVVTWDLKRGQQAASRRGRKAEVTCLARSHSGSLVAVGYADGAIVLWNTQDGTEGTAFQGHKGAVTALCFDADDGRLASGARDTTVIVWDVVGERGLYRLHGHKDMVTACRFLRHADQLLTGSKDTLVKLWDLTTQHCVETLVAHRSEVWTLDVSDNELWLVTGSSDPELRVWRIDVDLLGRQLDTSAPAAPEAGHPPRAITALGTVPRHSTERAATLLFLPGGHFLACQALDKTVEIFRLMDATDALRRRQKKAARKGRKAAAAATAAQDGDADAEADADGAAPGVELAATDLLIPFHTIRSTTAKIRSIDVAATSDAAGAATDAYEVLLALANNTIEVHSFLPGLRIKGAAAAASADGPSSTLHYTVEAPGHSSDVRTLALSSDDQLLCSGSNKGIKIWNMRTRTCIRTLDAGYALTSVFTPSNRHVVIGTKAGTLELFDIPSATCIATIPAHNGAVWSIALTADGRSLVSGSADHDVKFWDFELAETENSDGQLTLVHTRTLRMADDVLAVVCSADGKLLAISLLDATVKVFYIDTLKFFLSLYGHKLPVLSMDIASDSTLLVTASADKSVKLWGLDFGDCHRSLLAHGDSVMAVRFVPNTHYFFSAGKDRMIKYWDGDKFENIMKLDGHHGEVWTLLVSRLGDFVVSGGHDRSIRVWDRTEEQLFLEEEREKELETLFEASVEDAGRGARGASATDEEVDSAGRQTVETVKAGERIIEALELAHEEMAKWALHAAEVAANPHGKATKSTTPAHYVLNVVAGIASADLEEALIILPLDHILKLMSLIDEWFSRKWRVELACRVLFQLLQLHQDQIVAHRAIRPLLDTLRTKAREVLLEHRDMVGFNLAALQFLRRDWEAAASANLFTAPASLGSELSVKRTKLM